MAEVRYYGGRGDLDRLIADPTVDIQEVVSEVERLCNRDAHAAEYYSKHPELLYPAHPWVRHLAAAGGQ